MIRRKEVLIIDDSAEHRAYVKKILENAKFSVTEAESVEEGFAAVETSPPHLILLDLEMPDENGLKFLERKRSVSTLAFIPVMVLSGNRDTRSIYLANSLGATDYLAKPIGARTLVLKAKKAVRDQSFPLISFTKNVRPRVRVKVPARIVMMNASSLLLLCSLKIREESKLQIESTLLEELNLKNCVFIRTRSFCQAVGVGRYLNEISLVGLDSKTVKNVQESIRSWK